MIPRELPSVGGPFGFGANRMTTPPSAPSSGGSPLVGSFFSPSSANSSGAISSRRFCQSLGLDAATSFRTKATMGATSLA